jgi:hypothetical protein
MGPVSLRPIAGAGWAPRKRPERQRADYNRRHATRYVFGAYDLHADRLRVRLRPRRRGRDMLAFMQQIRACYPARRRIYRRRAGAPARRRVGARVYLVMRAPRKSSAS